MSPGQHSKVSPTDRSPYTRQYECPTVCRPQLPPIDDGRNGGTQVGLRETMKEFVGDHHQIEGDYVSGVLRETMHVFQRISLAIQLHYNSVAFLGPFWSLSN